MHGMNIKKTSHITMESYFQHWFSVSIWCSITGKCLTGPFIIEEHMTVAYCPNFLQDSLALLLKDFPLHTRLKMWFEYEVAPPHVGRQVTEYFTCHFPNWWIGYFDSGRSHTPQLLLVGPHQDTVYQ